MPNVYTASVSQSSSILPLTCTHVCCALPQEKPFQAKDFKAKNKDRTFQIRWYSDFPQITVCSTCNKAFCYACREANKKGLLNFSKSGDEAFTKCGFNNRKKSLEKLRRHEASKAHKEAFMKLSFKMTAQGEDVMISSQLMNLQVTCRVGLLKQITSLRFVFRLGLAIKGPLRR